MRGTVIDDACLAARATLRRFGVQSCEHLTVEAWVRRLGIELVEAPLDGTMLIVDETRAVLGSTALSTLSLDFRREVSVVVHDPALVKQLNMSYQELTAKAGAAATHLPGDRIA